VWSSEGSYARHRTNAQMYPTPTTTRSYKLQYLGVRAYVCIPARRRTWLEVGESSVLRGKTNAGRWRRYEKKDGGKLDGEGVRDGEVWNCLLLYGVLGGQRGGARGG